ncbi:bacteriocin fulvocin C-related protein [Kibdelosporangium aridum]|nr:bacteriocin fulvocin C-related protein [Kibdelosporangium aridum]
MTQWILAFDADCHFCRDVIDRIQASANGALTIAGLKERHIQELRERVLGQEPVWAPTLLAVDGENVRAWTGAALSVRMARLLGVRGSLRVASALKDAEIVQHPGRRRLLKAVPGLALGAFLATGGLATPAMAQPGMSKARRWALANADRLPTAYDDVISYPMAYRKAIVAALPPHTRSALWAEHIRRFQAAQPMLTGPQKEVIGEALRVVSRSFTADGNQAAPDALYEAAVAAFGVDKAQELLKTLGPKSDAVAPAASGAELEDCENACKTDGCGGGEVCYAEPWNCNRTSVGCGIFWLSPCDGTCR